MNGQIVEVFNAVFETLVQADLVCPEHGPYTSEIVRFAGHQQWSPCRRCAIRDLRAIAARESGEAARQRIQNRVERAGVPKIYAAALLENCDQAAAVTEWLKSPSSSLALLGNIGTGKTYLACAALISAAIQGRECRYVTAAGFLRSLRSSWGQPGDEMTVLRPLTECDLLVLDDIGANRAVEHDDVSVHELVVERVERGAKTIFVSNLAPDGLRMRMGMRAFDRMRAGCVQISMVGESRRKPSGVINDKR